MSILSFEQVTLSGIAKPRLDQVSLSIQASECVFLLGPNGAGKSSVLRTALGLHEPARGRVLVHGQPSHRMSAKQRARQLAWLPQQWSIDQALTARQVVAIARFRFGESRRQAEAKAFEWLGAVRAADFAERRITELSGGEQQRVKLAALLAQEAPLLLLDEPANHLDPAQQLEIYQLLGEQWRQGHSVLCVTHDINLVSRVGQAERVRLVGMRDGRILFDSHLAEDNLAQKLSLLYDVPFEQLQYRGAAADSSPIFAPSPSHAADR